MKFSTKYAFYKEEKLAKKPEVSFLIRTFTKEDVEDCAKFITKTDLASHPYYINLDWDFSRCEKFFLEYLRTYLEEERSLVAVIDGKIIGFIGARDYSRPSNVFLYDNFPELKRFDLGLDNIESNLKEFDKPNIPDEAAFVTTMVVDLEHQGLGVGGLLLNFINYSTKIKHFKKFLIEAASLTSKRMIDKLGFKTLASVKYIDLLDEEGKKPFGDIMKG